MDLQNFIEKFAELFDELDGEMLTSDTRFKELNEWGSMLIMLTIAMIDHEYNITIDDSDIEKSNTIEDLFNLIKTHKV
jgi:acyl carrier protein